MLYEYYLPILIFLCITIAVSITVSSLNFLTTKILGITKPDAEKDSAYECGFPELDDRRIKFDIKFYLVAILFLIFDLEMAFMFPWAIALKHIGWIGFGAMMLFLGILLIGFIYEWKKGALEWE